MNIYVGNLAYEVKEDALESLFAEFGTVRSAKVVRDTESGRSRGFGFVEMESAQEAEQAIEALNGQEFNGRKLVVNQARPKQPRNEAGGPGRRGNRNNDGRPPRRDRDRAPRRE